MTAPSKVVLVKCESYNQEEVDSALERGLKLLGGISQFIKSNEKVLLKPNVLWGTDPDKCVVTHPSVFKAVAKQFKKAGFQLSYGDSPGGLQQASNAMKKPGFSAIAEELDIPLGDFDHGKDVSNPLGIISKRLHIANAVLNSDAVVSIPKLKTHALTRMTGAIKNQYGCVPGIIKGENHARFPDVLDFSKLLADITLFIRPRLYIMDAVIAMEGEGPQSGDPKKLGLLILSNDPVALDTIASRVIDLDPSFVPTIEAGIKAGIGSNSTIELLGDPLEQFICKDFDVIRKAVVAIPRNGIHSRLKTSLVPRPQIDNSKCIKCGRCVEVCPVKKKAVDWGKQGKVKPPVYDYSVCIRCYCCHEMCPAKAIYMHTPILGRLLPIASYIALLTTNFHVKKRNRA